MAFFSFTWLGGLTYGIEIRVDSISLSPSIVNSACKLSKSTILLKKIFQFNFQVPTSIFKLNIRWCKSWVSILSSGLRTGGLLGLASNKSKHGILFLFGSSLLWGARDAIEDIKDELISMRSFLADADRKGVGSEGERTWVANVRDMAYDVEDIIDNFMYHMNRQRIGGRSSWILHHTIYFPRNLWMRHQTATKIQKINGKIKGAIPERNQRYGIDRIEGTSSKDNQKWVIRSMTQLTMIGLTNVKAADEMDLCDSIHNMKLMRYLCVMVTNAEETLRMDALSSPPTNLQKLFGWKTREVTQNVSRSVAMHPRSLHLVVIWEYFVKNDAEDYGFALFASKGLCFVRSSNSKYCLGILMSKTLLPLLNKNEVVDNGIPVIMYDIKGKEHSMTFKLWEPRVYVLKEGWNMFCQNHSLREYEDFVTVWMFLHVQTIPFHLFKKTKLHK
ncbi:hypothetical protein CMV_011297 [Castanea mollissima]|uniref:Disease resistance N-terminal domain-containing protein n=1 Tax=Castanea mollissima TaxID=60419 RepID=A0A8J4R437_9ROSI|nr:hypothetical protein CMV_011297 [Castanea mollissima]